MPQEIQNLHTQFEEAVKQNSGALLARELNQFFTILLYLQINIGVK